MTADRDALLLAIQALTPLADLAQLFDDDRRSGSMPGGDEEAVMSWPRMDRTFELQVGDLRQARVALEALQAHVQPDANQSLEGNPRAARTPAPLLREVPDQEGARATLLAMLASQCETHDNENIHQAGVFLPGVDEDVVRTLFKWAGERVARGKPGIETSSGDLGCQRALVGWARKAVVAPGARPGTLISGTCTGDVYDVLDWAGGVIKKQLAAAVVKPGLR